MTGNSPSDQRELERHPSIPCELTPGMRDEERTAAVTDVRGRTRFLRAEVGFFDQTPDGPRIPVGVVGVDRAAGLVLVELPHETDDGVSRLWVRESDLRPDLTDESDADWGPGWGGAPPRPRKT